MLRLPLVRAVLSIANKYNLNLHQLDVKTAFLNGTLDNEIDMEIPDGYECEEETKKQSLQIRASFVWAEN